MNPLMTRQINRDRAEQIAMDFFLSKEPLQNRSDACLGYAQSIHETANVIGVRLLGDNWIVQIERETISTATGSLVGMGSDIIRKVWTIKIDGQNGDVIEYNKSRAFEEGFLNLKSPPIY